MSYQPRDPAGAFRKADGPPICRHVISNQEGWQHPDGRTAVHPRLQKGS